MSVKFRKKIRIFPGFSLNLSKSGMSATLGIRGCSVNIGSNGTYLNTGIPGTGLYDRIKLQNPLNDDSSDISVVPDNSNHVEPVDSYTVDTEIKSYNPEVLTSDTMTYLKQSIIDADRIKKEMYQEWQDAIVSKKRVLFRLVILHFIIVGFFLKKLKQDYKDKKRFAEELKQDYDNFSINLDFDFDKDTLNDYITIRKNFEELSHAKKIWDVTSYKNTDQYHERTTATRALTRTPVSFYNKSLDFIKTSYDALVLQNANGGDLYIYPGFVIVKENSSKDFGIVDLKNIKFLYYDTDFMEEGSVPSDSQNIGYTWKYCNKNGSPDRRYTNNYQIPIQRYGTIVISSEEGLNEEFMISNANATVLFTTALYNFVDLLNKMSWNSKLVDDDNIDNNK